MTLSIKKLMRMALCFFLVETMYLHVLFIGPASPLEEVSPVDNNSFFTWGDSLRWETKIFTQTINDVNTLVLPSSASPENMVLYTNISDRDRIKIVGNKGKMNFPKAGEPIDLTQICENGDYNLKFIVTHNFKNWEYDLRVVFSENVPAMYIMSDYPDFNGRYWVEESFEKQNKATGHLLMQDADGTLTFDGRLSQIKGRGNSTWGFDKKPYQIKLEEGADLLNSGNKENKDKTWVLLANYKDTTLIHNKIIQTLTSAMDPGPYTESIFVDLYYDGEYRGNYQLSEKVEVGKGRVEITDLDKKNEEVNVNVNAENLTPFISTTANGAFFTYTNGLRSPEDIRGGYLIEMDFEERAKEEPCYFRTTRGQYIVVKSPEFATREEMNYIATLYQNYENAVFNGGTDPATGKHYSEFVDADSLANYYLLNEFSKARDSFRSSAYLYKNTEDDKLYMGPLWDYDLSFGAGGAYNVADPPVGSMALSTPICSNLIKIDSFYSLVKNTYIEKLYPMIQSILSEDGGTSELVTVSELADYVSVSAALDAEIWHDGRDWDKEIADLRSFISRRADVLKEVFETYPSAARIPQNHFLDVLPSAPYHDDVVYVHLYNLMEDLGYNLFDPETYVRRAHTVKVMYNMACREVPVYKQVYTDVTINDWYAYALAWATDKGLVRAYPHGKFKPETYVSKEEVADMLYRLSSTPVSDHTILLNYEDFNCVTVSARDAMSWAISEGLFELSDNLIEPHKFVTRAELASIIAKFYPDYLEVNPLPTPESN